MKGFTWMCLLLLVAGVCFGRLAGAANANAASHSKDPGHRAATAPKPKPAGTASFSVIWSD